MAPDYKTLVTTMSRAIEEKKSPHNTIGTLQALLWMVLEELPEEKAAFYVKLIDRLMEDLT